MGSIVIITWPEKGGYLDAICGNGWPEKKKKYVSPQKSNRGVPLFSPDWDFKNVDSTL